MKNQSVPEMSTKCTEILKFVDGFYGVGDSELSQTGPEQSASVEET